MTAREQTSDCELNCLILAYDYFTNLLRESVNVVRHSEIICGNDAIRKQDMRRFLKLRSREAARRGTFPDKTEHLRPAVRRQTQQRLAQC
jgi:hypothetical protein